MQDILGRTFSVGDGEYRVVDVRQLSGEVMVYAEQTAEEVTEDRLTTIEGNTSNAVQRRTYRRSDARIAAYFRWPL